MYRLEDLARVLMHSEIRHLRQQLNLKSFQKDICGNLPIELLLEVCRYLELRDLKTALLVTHRWNEVFSSPEFYCGIAKLHFRSIWEICYKDLEPEQQQSRNSMLYSWVPDAMSKRMKRLYGKYHAMSKYYYAWGDQCPLELTTAFERPQYCNARVAYRVDETTIMVRDLRTEQARVFADDNRANIRKWLLGDKCMVAQIEFP